METVEKYSGLRIKNRVVAGMVVEDRFADLRFDLPEGPEACRQAAAGPPRGAGGEEPEEQLQRRQLQRVEALRPRQGRRVHLGVPLRPGAHRQLEGTRGHDLVRRRRAAQRVARRPGRRPTLRHGRRQGPAGAVEARDVRGLWPVPRRQARRSNCTMHVNRSLASMPPTTRPPPSRLSRSGRARGVSAHRTAVSRAVMGTGGGNGGKTPLPPVHGRLPRPA